jgi:hypothetical protein
MQVDCWRNAARFDQFLGRLPQQNNNSNEANIDSIRKRSFAHSRERIRRWLLRAQQRRHRAQSTCLPMT